MAIALALTAISCTAVSLPLAGSMLRMRTSPLSAQDTYTKIELSAMEQLHKKGRDACLFGVDADGLRHLPDALHLRAHGLGHCFRRARHDFYAGLEEAFLNVRLAQEPHDFLVEPVDDRFRGF